jgi:ABC-type uncharacterized transport system ATPase subunit
MKGETPLLRLRDISKMFGSLVANDQISFDLHEGEIVALLGENGAGKTTLMNILFGHYVADGGSIDIDGVPLTPGSPKDALRAGLGMVHQHFTLADNMTVLDNIMLGTEPLYLLKRNNRRATAKIKGLIERYEIDVNPAILVKNLSVGQRQRVEILKALYRDTRILILDEPTAVLTPQESEHLFATLKLLVKQGLAIIFITHKLREVMAVSDRCLVLRHGTLTYESRTDQTSITTLAREMVGGEIPKVERLPIDAGQTLLSLDRLSVVNKQGYQFLENVSLELKAGEILGIAGVSGNGQSHLADLISGLLRPTSGSFLLHGKQVTHPTPLAMIKKGVGRIPEDRTGTGVIGDMNVLENMASESYWRSGFNRFGLLNFKALSAHSKQLSERYDVRCGGLDVPVRALSGGNMQKLILARVLSEKPSVIIANQPTWGLDVGATAFVHRQLIKASREGAGVIIISEDLDELFAVADCLQVMYRGTLSAPIDPAATSASEVGLAMSGHRDIVLSAALKGAEL